MTFPGTRPALSAFGPTLVDDTPVIDPTRNLGADVLNALRENVAAVLSAAPLGWALVTSSGVVTAAGGRLAGCTASSPGAGLMDVVPAAGTAPAYLGARATVQDATAAWFATAAVDGSGQIRVRTVTSASTATVADFLVVVF